MTGFSKRGRIHASNFSTLEVPYGGKLWRVQTLVEWQGKHHWRNKLWRIDHKSLIKRILKQFEYKSTHNWSIRVHVFAMLIERCSNTLLSSSLANLIVEQESVLSISLVYKRSIQLLKNQALLVPSKLHRSPSL